MPILYIEVSSVPALRYTLDYVVHNYARKISTNPDKYYMVDTGVVRAMTPKNDAEKGWLLENLVFLHFRRGNNKIEYYIKHLDQLYTLSATGQKLTQKIFDLKKQKKDRAEFIKKYLGIRIKT